MNDMRRKEDQRRAALEQLDKRQQERLEYALKSWHDYYASQQPITNNKQHGR